MTHILITRPLEASSQLADQLNLPGMRPVIMPLYDFASHNPGFLVEDAFGVQEGRKLAVFTSPRAVQFGLEHIPTGQLAQLEFAAIGAATRTLLEQNNIDVQIRPGSGFTSEDLLKATELTTNPGSAVIFCAPGGREKLAKGLQELGWEVSMAMVYQRQPLRPTQDQVDAIADADSLISVWTSISAVDLAMEYLPSAVWRKILRAPALVISARIQHHLQQAGATHVTLSEGPGNIELLRSVKAVVGN